jgi:hypothetical protein
VRLRGISRWAAAALAGAVLVGAAQAGAMAGGTTLAGVRGEPGGGDLMGVFCTSSVNCWAVGASFLAAREEQLSEILHWDGSAWSQVAVPNPSRTAQVDFSELFAVRCTAPGNCWAVGEYHVFDGAMFNEALHWNGSAWSVVSAPQPGGRIGGSVNGLFDVVCRSSANCWAVGHYGKLRDAASSVERNEVLHWNGRKWALQRTPDPGGTSRGDINQLNSVRCATAHSCLAVGSTSTAAVSSHTGLNEVLRWDGRKWLTASVPSPGGPPGTGGFSELVYLTCTSPANCWAVGDYGAPGTVLSQILHWNGIAWSQASVPELGGTGSPAIQRLSGVTCSSATNCWAVGSYVLGNDTGAALNEALHWDGGAWSLVSTPDPGGVDNNAVNQLNAVRCTSRTDCWTVGTAGPSLSAAGNEALRWDGTIWSAG